MRWRGLLEHGGRLLDVARRYGIPPEEWLDLSTGINPNGWPVADVPASAWRRLPEDDDGLLDAARDYYRCDRLLAVAGSQQAIMALPALRPPGRVGLLHPAYAEHRLAWHRAGHGVVELTPATIDAELPRLDVLLVVNPNNPTGWRFGPAQLMVWRDRLAASGGWLVVDEAFADTEPGLTVAAETGRPGLIVLRSVGKFFGLAGARVGFVLGWPELLDELAARIGPWPIANPARHVVAAALRDREWQRSARLELAHAGDRLARLLAAHGLQPNGGCALFQWLRHPLAGRIQAHFARQGILIRRFDEPASLRFGLPGNEQAWHRLEMALEGR